MAAGAPVSDGAAARLCMRMPAPWHTTTRCLCIKYTISRSRARHRQSGPTLCMGASRQPVDISCNNRLPPPAFQLSFGGGARVPAHHGSSRSTVATRAHAGLGHQGTPQLPAQPPSVRQVEAIEDEHRAFEPVQALSNWLGSTQADRQQHLNPIELDACAQLLEEAQGSVQEANRIITRRIKKADSFRALQVLFKQFRPVLNAIHVCAVLTRLKVLVGPSRSGARARGSTAAGNSEIQASVELVQVAQWVPDFLAATEHLLPSFTMLEVAGCLHALVRLKLRGPTLWTQHLIRHSLPILHTATAAQISTAVWGFACIGIDPGEAWLDQACACSIPLLSGRSNRTPANGSMQQQDTTWGSTASSRSLSVNVYQAALHDLDSEREDNSGCATSTMVSLCWGLAKLRHNVSPAWSEAFCAEMAARWTRMDAFSLSNMAWALATLAVQPGREWVQEFGEVSQRVMQGASSFDLSVMLWAMITWQHKPSNQWFESFVVASSAALPLAQPEHIARTLWCMATLRWRPPGWWLNKVFQQTMVQAFDFDAQAYSNSFWALAKLQTSPPSDWLETMLVAIYEQGMDGWGPQELSNTMWALGRWRHAAEPSWSELFWREVYHQLPFFNPQQQVNVLWGTIRTGQAPPPNCLKLLTKVSYQSRDQYTLEGWATLISCYAALEVRPGPAWRTAFFTLTLPQLHRMALTHRGRGSPGGSTPTAATGLSIAAGEVPATADTSSSYQDQSGGDSASGQPASSVVGAITARSGGLGGGRDERDSGLSGGVGSELASVEGPRRTPGQAARSVASGLVCEKLVGSLATLNMQPPDEWCDAFLAASLAHMCDMRQGNLASVAYGVVRLSMQPPREWVQAFVDAAESRLQPSTQLNRVSLGKLLYAARQLPDAQQAYASWRNADWIGTALELYD